MDRLYKGMMGTIIMLIFAVTTLTYFQCCGPVPKKVDCDLVCVHSSTQCRLHMAKLASSKACWDATQECISCVQSKL